jgi:hypothetical protein
MSGQGHTRLPLVLTAAAQVLRRLDDLAMTPVSEGRDARTDRHRGRQGSSMSNVSGACAVTLPPTCPLRHQPHASVLHCICRLPALLCPREMSDLSPQTGPKRTLLLPRNFMSTRCERGFLLWPQAFSR